jgi:DNA-directed RNA polymerase subunit RPC12/RpoP
VGNYESREHDPVARKCVYCGTVTYFAPRGRGSKRVYKCRACGAPLGESDAETPREGTTTCENCGKKLRADEASHLYGKEYCADCVVQIRRGGKSVYARCAGCGAPLHVEDLTKIGNFYYCDECREG